MALLHVLARVKADFGLTLFAHGVDHGLRPEAARELDLAEAFAVKLNVPFGRTCVEVPPGGNVQSRARDARWQALRNVAVAHGAAIATAHHADDRAETVLMRILRGAGVRGLAVLPPRSDAYAPAADASGDSFTAAESSVTVVRPLLRARREDILLHLERHQVPFATDPSNANPRYLRTSVRNDVLPLLAKLDPSIVRHLEALADELVKIAPGGKSRAWQSALPRPTQEALEKLAASGSPDARVWLPGGLVVSLDPRARKRGVQCRTVQARALQDKPRG
jgi:tRNA(Ile)-lysidine synthase